MLTKNGNQVLNEAATGGILQKNLFLKISQYTQENTCVGVSCVYQGVRNDCWKFNVLCSLPSPNFDLGSTLFQRRGSTLK